MTTAAEIRAARWAGLQLCGQEKDGCLQWLGTHRQWSDFRHQMRFREVEKGVFIKKYGQNG